MSRHDPLRGAPGHVAGGIGRGGPTGQGMTLEMLAQLTAQQRQRAVPCLGVNFDPTHAQILVEGRHPLDVGKSTIIAVPIETYLLLAGQITVGAIVPMLAAHRQAAERGSPASAGETVADDTEGRTVEETASRSADVGRQPGVFVVRLFSAVQRWWRTRRR